jgi:hypothetical protein
MQQIAARKPGMACLIVTTGVKTGAAIAGFLLVPEVARAREDHCQAVLVAGGDYLGVAA